MRTYVLLALLGLFICLVSAKDGSISDHLSDDDENDDEEVDTTNDGLTEEKSRENPCKRKKCRRGEMCVLDENWKPKCRCYDRCEMLSRKFAVCSNKNVTYDSECHLDQDHCLCKRNKEGCSTPGLKKVQLEYYGECQEQDDCSPEQAEQFPERLRDWLFIVMEDLASRSEIDEYQDLLEEAANDEFHAYAVIWKFCDLDKDPQDRLISRRELQYTVRSLRAMESCLLPFLDGCDADNDRQIALTEWGKCLGLETDEISNKCVDIHKNRRKNKE